VSPEPEINITHNIIPPSSICHFASEMAQPVANAPHSPFAIRFSVKICKWRMQTLSLSRTTTTHWRQWQSL